MTPNDSLTTHILDFADVAGRPIRLSMRCFWRSLISPAGLLFIALSYLMMVLADPPNLLEVMSMPLAMLVWAVSYAVYLTGYFATFFLLAFAHRRGWVDRIWTPSIGLFIIVPTVVSSEALVRVIVGPAYPLAIIQKIVFFYLIVQIVEFAYVTWFLRETEPQSAEPVANEPASLHLGPHEIALPDLLYLCAQEHFVRAKTTGDELLHRARLSELVRQTTPDEGVQPHRSWWISRHSDPKLARTDSGKPTLTLRDGTIVPVAKGRLPEVEQWLNETISETLAS